MIIIAGFIKRQINTGCKPLREKKKDHYSVLLNLDRETRNRKTFPIGERQQW